MCPLWILSVGPVVLCVVAAVVSTVRLSVLLWASASYVNYVGAIGCSMLSELIALPLHFPRVCRPRVRGATIGMVRYEYAEIF